MTRTLPTLHDGHAPIVLHQAFADALDAFEDWTDDAEPTVAVDGRDVLISSVFGRMRRCSDILPERLRVDIPYALGGSYVGLDLETSTFADAATVLRARCVERLKAVAA